MILQTVILNIIKINSKIQNQKIFAMRSKRAQKRYPKGFFIINPEIRLTYMSHYIFSNTNSVGTSLGCIFFPVSYSQTYTQPPEQKNTQSLCGSCLADADTRCLLDRRCLGCICRGGGIIMGWHRAAK